MATLITIWWRDIPMQVIAREGRRTEKRVLDKRFQFAVDKAAHQVAVEMDAVTKRTLQRRVIPLYVHVWSPGERIFNRGGRTDSGYEAE